MPPIDRTGIRSPLLSIAVDGSQTNGLLDARIVSTNYYSCDWFEVSFSLDLPQSPSIDFWMTVSNPLIEITAASRQSQPSTSLILGHADSIAIDVRRRVVSVVGRDLSALMVDTSISRGFPNHSAGEIATFIAAFHGLNPHVVPTADILGRSYGGIHTISVDPYYSRSVTDWDLIVRMAVQHGYDAYVEGRDFFFRPSREHTNGTLLVRPGDCSQIRVTRNVGLERRRPSQLSSWNQQLQQELTDATVAGTTAISNQSAEYFEPNISANQLTSIISRVSRMGVAQGLRIQLTMPGDTRVSARSRLLLQGVAGRVDGEYDVECIERTFNINSGFTQHVRGCRRDMVSSL